MSRFVRSLLCAAIGALIAGAALQHAEAEVKSAPPAAPSQDRDVVKPPHEGIPEDRATSGSSTEPLSKKLDRQGGVIRPPAAIDPEMTQHPPQTGSSQTPVIRPPGTPGGEPGPEPK